MNSAAERCHYGRMLTTVEARLFARARAGGEEAFRELVHPYRRELGLHCYRILGSVQDSEDVLQETLLSAWRGLDRFKGDATVRAWLYRIATNGCLNALRTRSRRPREASPEPAGSVEPLTVGERGIVAITGFADTSAFRCFGFPRMLHE
jgi:DNA-directed RNA polymerase specialized sigma24 family protein